MPVIREMQPLAELSSDLYEQLGDWIGDPDTTPRSFQATGDSPTVLPYFTRLGTTGSVGTLIVLEDATDITQQMQQLKLASLGRLTASIAHEIRNPLGAISHAAQLLDESRHVDQADRRLTEIIRDHSRRMNTIVENVLQLSRRENSQPQTFDLAPWLQHFVEELRAVEHLEPDQVTLDVSPQDVTVHIDPSHLQQVLWNLCQNAIQHGAGQGHVPKLMLRGGITAESPAPYVDVIDNGGGIDPQTVQQIFDPFYTTSSNGTGLGLYIARELCEINRARLNYIAVPTGGSCFRISFHDPNRIRL
jgi:two-component system sensor histidine kinase PilS (NtrC family)